jgi:polyisoprenyl-teichoic acid--peptidoglycan teichoic acid transferase
VSPSPAPSPIDVTAAPFTVLLLGGDTGLRTDAVMVLGIDPVHQRLTFASVPRDTIDIPLPDGTIYRDAKINSFYDYAASNPARYPQGPGRATADAVSTLLGIRIDFWALTTFDGFEKLVGALHGVPIVLSHSIVDRIFLGGVFFPAGRQVLGPARALAFVRTRYDNDFAREARQHQFLIAAARQLLAQPALLPGLLAAIPGTLRSDLPLDKAAAVLEAMATFNSKNVTSIVLGPRNYERGATCTCGYALVPLLGRMRARAAALFPWAVP